MGTVERVVFVVLLLTSCFSLSLSLSLSLSPSLPSPLSTIRGTNTKVLDASADEVAAAQQVTGTVLPVRLDNKEPVKFMRITQEMVDDDVRGTLRKSLLLQKRRGKLDKRYEARLKREAEAALSKKKKGGKKDKKKKKSKK